MTSTDIIVVLLLGVGVACSLTLLFWLVRLIKRDRRGNSH
ncbi:hypothetical protein GCM10027278_37280 [Paralcaligenes ginsengisoli]